MLDGGLLHETTLLLQIPADVSIGILHILADKVTHRGCELADLIHRTYGAHFFRDNALSLTDSVIILQRVQKKKAKASQHMRMCMGVLWWWWWW